MCNGNNEWMFHLSIEIKSEAQKVHFHNFIQSSLSIFCEDNISQRSYIHKKLCYTCTYTVSNQQTENCSQEQDLYEGVRYEIDSVKPNKMQKTVWKY